MSKHPLEYVASLPQALVEEAFGSREELSTLVATAQAPHDEDDYDPYIAAASIGAGSYHQDVLFPVAEHIPELLVRMLDDGAQGEVPFALLGSLAEHAGELGHERGWAGLRPQGSAFGPLIPHGEDGSRSRYVALAQATHDAVQRRLDRIVPWIDRWPTATLYVLSYLDEWTDDARARTIECTRAPDVFVRAAAWIAIGVHARRTGHEGELAALREAWRRGSTLEAWEREGLAIAVGYTGAHDELTPLVDVLSEAMRRPRATPGELPWFQGALAGMAAEALTLVDGVDPTRVRDVLTDAFVAQVDEGTEAPEDLEIDWPLPDHIAEQLVRAAFSELRDRDEETVFEELNAAQQRVLRVLFERRCHPPMLDSCGVRRLSARYVGVSPRGPVDEPLTIGGAGASKTHPVWKWWWMSMREAVAPDALVRALIEAREPSQLVALALDLSTWDYDIQGITPSGVVPLALAVLEQAEGVEPVLEHHVAAFLAEPPPELSPLAAVMLPWMTHRRRSGRRMEPAYLPLVRRLHEDLGLRALVEARLMDADRAVLEP